MEENRFIPVSDISVVVDFGTAVLFDYHQFEKICRNHHFPASMAAKTVHME